ncbi:MAG: DUF1553 domain-containing protein [Pirellulaceae bacterium]|nr:DUF1553 domain-containing protein [Pirellulaceae bacterium]
MQVNCWTSLRNSGWLIAAGLASSLLVGNGHLPAEEVTSAAEDPHASAEVSVEVAEYYVQHVKPILTARCYACHGALKQEAGLRLDTVAAMLSGGDSGPVVASERDATSLLLERITHVDRTQRMPPEGAALTAAEANYIADWIRAGAPAPPDDAPQLDPREHWSLRPPLGFSQTGNARQEMSNPIDGVLSIRQQQLGIQPLPDADRRTLVRRLYLDLLGLPPSPEEVTEFLADPHGNAYQRLVERLLQRDEYGQRWGRHWMDVWRYSDWYGRRSVPDVMNSYPQIWRWRDWIVRSLNEDKGYDRMVMEMLAADELAPTDDENLVATGFLVRNWYKWNYESWMKDNVEHTAKAFLGLTINCAHCHDHKYDPITQEDYFRFRAFFEPLELRHDRVAGQADPGPFKKYVYADSYGPIATGAIRVFDEKLDAQTFMYHSGDARNRIEDKPPLEPSPPQALCSQPFVIEPVTLPSEASYPGLKEFVRRDELHNAAAQQLQAEQLCEQAAATLATANRRLDDLFAQSAQPITAAALPSSETLARAEHDLLIARQDLRVAQAARLVAEARSTALRSRIAADDACYRGLGDAQSLARHAHVAERQLTYESAEHALQVTQRAHLHAQRQVAEAPAEKIEKAKEELTKASQAVSAARTALDTAIEGLNSTDTSYTPLSPSYPASSSGRRLALARWITSPQNTLAARVAVNHIWLRHFGQALVQTTDNFGAQGKPPTHPEILDGLAVELMQHGWSMKHIHRLIVTSQAYRRASNPSVDHSGLDADRDNESYWRRLPLRMEAEVVRDSVLACAGLLDRSLGGPEIDNTHWFTVSRRSLYFTIHGEAKMQFMDTFDGPNVSECYRRTSTVLPQQSLAMTNSELMVSSGRSLAAAVVQQLSRQPDDSQADSDFVDLAFQRVLSRPPSLDELQVSLEFLEQQRQQLSAVSTDQRTLTGAQDVLPASRDIAQRARENLAISLFSHNDFVTIR